MNKPFKLDFQVNNRGNLRAEFRDADNKVGSISEANTGNEVNLFIGVNGFLSRLNREMAEEIGIALLRFALNGTLAENLIGKPLAVGCTLEFAPSGPEALTEESEGKK